MKNFFSLSTKNDLELFIKNKGFKRIFVIAGSKSYKLSGAKKIFDPLLKGKKTQIFFFRNF